MNRPAFAVLTLAGLVVAFEFPAPMARATSSLAFMARAASPAPSASPSPGNGDSQPAPNGTSAPSPTVVVPLVDLSVSNGSAPPAAPTAAPPTESPAPGARDRRFTTRPATTPIPPDRRTAATPQPEEVSGTSIPTQPPTPRPVAALQPSIPDSLDDRNVQSILARQGGQLGPFNWMSGQWSAHMFESRNDGTRKDLGQDTYVFAATMKGRWMFGGDGRATDYFYISYDPFASQWAIVRFNGNPSYGIWLSKSGWRDNQITFDSTYSWVNGRQYRRRLTIAHGTAKRFSMTDQEELPSGAWITDASVEFTKR